MAIRLRLRPPSTASYAVASCLTRFELDFSPFIYNLVQAQQTVATPTGRMAFWFKRKPW